MRDFYGEEDGWSQVSYRRGRLQQRPPQPRSMNRGEEDHPHQLQPPRGGRHTYASITRADAPQPWRQGHATWNRRGKPDHRHAIRRDNQWQLRQQPTHDHSNNGGSRPPTRVVSDDPDFSHKVRIIHRIIKSAHHLKNVSGSDAPPMIAKTTQSLATLIKPASPNDTTQLLLTGNAKNWEYTVMTILQQHYETSMNSNIHELAQFPSQDWLGPFKVATVWARKNLGRRLRPDTLHETETFLATNLTHQQQPTGTVRAQSTSPDTEALSASTQSRAQIAPRPQSVSTPLPPPPPASPVSVATMTDQRGGDWPPFPTEEDETATPLLPPPPLPSSPPPPLPSRSSPFSSPPPPSLPRLPPRSRRQQRGSSRKEQLTAGPTAEHITAEQPKRTPTLPRSSSLPPRLTLDPLQSEGDETAALQGATTPRKKLQQLCGGTSIVTPARRPTKHGNTGQRSKKEWVLCAGKQHLIVGDSNISRLPPFQRSDLQVDSFPGATFHHAEAIFRRSKRNRCVKTLILSFGLYNRHQKTRETTLKQLKGAVRAAAAKFPDAHILIPEVNVSPSLPLQQRLNLRVLNDFIKNHCEFIPHLPNSDFETESGGVRWSSLTASRMLDHWLHQLQIKSLISS